jgi:hypothetical protein
MKNTVDKTIFQEELKQITSRLKSENEALLKLIREINDAGDRNFGKIETKKPKK